MNTVIKLGLIGKGDEGVPGQSAGFRLPFVLEVAIIRPSVEETVELLVDQRTRTRFVEWVRLIPHPIPFEQIAPPQIVTDFHFVAPNRRRIPRYSFFSSDSSSVLRQGSGIRSDCALVSPISDRIRRRTEIGG